MYFVVVLNPQFPENSYTYGPFNTENKAILFMEANAHNFFGRVCTVINTDKAIKP